MSEILDFYEKLALSNEGDIFIGSPHNGSKFKIISFIMLARYPKACYYSDTKQDKTSKEETLVGDAIFQPSAVVIDLNYSALKRFIVYIYTNEYTDIMHAKELFKFNKTLNCPNLRKKLVELGLEEYRKDIVFHVKSDGQTDTYSYDARLFPDRSFIVPQEHTLEQNEDISNVIKYKNAIEIAMRFHATNELHDIMSKENILSLMCYNLHIQNDTLCREVKRLCTIRMLDGYFKYELLVMVDYIKNDSIRLKLQKEIKDYYCNLNINYAHT